MGRYTEAFRQSIEDPEGFWGGAVQGIDWYRQPAVVLDRSSPPFYRGVLNALAERLGVPAHSRPLLTARPRALPAFEMTGSKIPRGGAIGEPAAMCAGSFAVTTVMPSMLRAGLISKENKPGPSGRGVTRGAGGVSCAGKDLPRQARSVNKTEDDPLNPDPPDSARQTLAAIRRKGHGDDRHVAHDHELRHARQRQDHPVGSVTSPRDDPPHRSAPGSAGPAGVRTTMGTSRSAIA